MAANQVVVAVASGQESSMAYQSFLNQLVSTGGIMILCSLVGADDADTRAHATGSLGAIVTVTRNMDSSLQSLAEMTGTPKPPATDGQVIRAIVSGGVAVDPPFRSCYCRPIMPSQPDFLSFLILLLMQDARGTTALPTNYNVESDTTGLGAC